MKNLYLYYFCTRVLEGNKENLNFWVSFLIAPKNARTLARSFFWLVYKKTVDFKRKLRKDSKESKKSQKKSLNHITQTHRFYYHFENLVQLHHCDRCDEMGERIYYCFPSQFCFIWIFSCIIVVAFIVLGCEFIPVFVLHLMDAFLVQYYRSGSS